MLLATPALEAPVFLSAASPESTMPKQLVLTEADLASRWAPAMASPASAAPAPQSGGSYTPRPGNAQSRPAWAQ